MSARGRIPLRESSWMMHWYNEWRANKGWGKTERAQIDLCHFMRVLMIFGPWRWFWQSAVVWDLTPFLCALVLAGLGAIAGAFVFATGAALVALAYAGLALGVTTVLLLVGGLAHHWYTKDSEGRKAQLERVGDAVVTAAYYAFIPVWWPLMKIGVGFVRFAKWLAAVAIVPVGTWFFTKPLFSLSVGGELFTFSSFGLAVCLFFPAWIALLFYLHPVVLGIIFGGVLLAAAVVFAIVRVQRWAKARPPSAPVAAAPKPKKEHETAQLVWSWLVAKKHRICPLIEVE